MRSGVQDGPGGGLVFARMGDPADETSGPDDAGGSSDAETEPTGPGGIFINCGSSHAGRAGMYFGKGAGRSDLYGTEFQDNPTDIIAEGAVGQSFHGTKFLKDSGPEAEPPRPGRARRRLIGKTCAVCGFEGFRWQTQCPKGHPLS